MERMIMRRENPLWTWLNQLAFIMHSERPNIVSGPFGDHEVIYGEDENGDEFAFIKFTLPSPWLGEVDDTTNGTLYGFRIYMEDVQ